MEAVNTHIMQNNKIKHTFVIHRLLCSPSCTHIPAALQRTFQALYLLHKGLAALSTHRCKLVLHGLDAYLLNGLQQSSNAAVYKADVNKDGGR